MLRLVDIKKDYVIKGLEPVHALKGITVNFRRNEFVAILGHSGCGKTTLLNIIGGLDRYDSGDLLIEGKSTKEYSDRDWDTYRNHSIGFVFQSYNLIQHSSILANVELALTIAGVSKKERRERALAALEKVGLGGLANKKPNQLSGGQMQRVAIARALVNNPEILLADEPTGALDSETSVQIMDLLKEVASDRLVIMVTHNPDLATQYASRIIKMSDGVLTDDSNPYKGESEADREKAQKAKISKGDKAKTSMSFATAFGLSGRNLLSKLKRTILVSIAGSIGIIGVASVLSVSTGVNSYIDSMQDDMLSSYPLTIAEESVDYTSLMAGLSNLSNKENIPIDLSSKVGVDSMIAYLMDKYSDFTQVKTNDINEELLQYIADMDPNMLASINYKYNVDLTNNLFVNWSKDGDYTKTKYSLNGLTQMYIAELQTVKGFGEYAKFVDLFTGFLKQLPAGEDYISNQYDCIAGHFPTNDNELMLVVDNNQTETDILLAQLGFFTEEEFLNIARVGVWESQHKDATEEEKEAYRRAHDYPKAFDFDTILNKEFAYYSHDEMFNYGEAYRTIKPTIKILSDPTTKDYFTLAYDVNKDILEGEFSSYMLTFVRSGEKTGSYLGDWSTTIPSYGTIAVTLKDTEWAYKPFFPEYPYEAVVNLMGDIQTTGYLETDVPIITNGYYYPFNAKSSWNGIDSKIVGIYKPKSNIKFGSLSRGLYYTPKLTAKYMADAIISRIVNGFSNGGIHIDGMKDYITKKTNAKLPCYVKFTFTSFIDGDEHPIPGCEGVAYAINTNLEDSLSSMFGAGSSSLTDVNITYLRSISGISCKERHNPITDETYYEFGSCPVSVEFYPRNFKEKDQVNEYLKVWNSDKDIKLSTGEVLSKDMRDEITVTDTISLIIAVINTLILSVTIALVAFTSLSLVVSCFMIAVITYISTMERVKEIGVIRSLGGRKKDVSRLFIAECFITGLASGLIGVCVTFFLTLIINAVSAPLGVPQVAILTALITGSMIVLSILLNVLSGLIPSMKASRQDPVIALRSE